MCVNASEDGDKSQGEGERSRPVRADSRRNLDILLKASLEVFATSGVDAPVREIAARAGVGVGTLYRLSRSGPTSSLPSFVTRWTPARMQR
jgi:hypothetical protein